MTTRIAKEEIALMLPNRLAHYFTDDEEVMAPARVSPLRQHLAAAWTWLLEMPVRRAVINDLSVLSDHELADIGLTRGSLSQVFDAEFAATRQPDLDFNARPVRG